MSVVESFCHIDDFWQVFEMLEELDDTLFGDKG